MKHTVSMVCAIVLAWLVPATAEEIPLQWLQDGAHARQFSGIYPHLASFNSQGECGTGALLPWAGKLWWVTYSPHMPHGSDDKLYAINETLDLFVWPGSVGGTPANRFIHRESQQALIGPYVIDRQGSIRVIPPSVMPGRLTGNARHLTDPSRRVYYATMEEGFYEVDVQSLEVTELFPDANAMPDLAGPLLPGFHGKGLYSGQGQLVYANNGEPGAVAQTRPDIESGALAEWHGHGDWHVVRRNQFTEVTGPGGVAGNEHPEQDPIWSIGWDHRSLILMLRSDGAWQHFRLPKASHCYDGAHGWHTEWPRIREIGEDDLLMTMHGMFWRFPSTLRGGHTGGIRPRSTYLKVIGDFCRWQDRLVLGCDDAAHNEFLNTRIAKGQVAGPAESQSNLWFIAPAQLDCLGLPLGRGAVWLDDPVQPMEPSDAFLFGGFAERSVHLAHDASDAVTFRFEVDRRGDGHWTPLEDVTVGPHGYSWHAWAADQDGEWIRITASGNCRATAWFEYRGGGKHVPHPAHGTTEVAELFAGLAPAGQGPALGGYVRAGARQVGLQILATQVAGNVSRETGCYTLTPDLSLVRDTSPPAQSQLAEAVAIPTGILRLEGNSILYRDDDGTRYRLPIGNPVYGQRPELLDLQRTSREVTTERDLFQCAGTFFELPARGAGGVARIRPVATHPFFIQDYCSWRGLLVLTGVAPLAELPNTHIMRSADGLCAVWLGAVDDLWTLGKPTGRGGPWASTPVRRDEPSDPYLCAGYDHKVLLVSHDASATVTIRVDVDISGTGRWHTFTTLAVAAGMSGRFEFPAGFQAYWVRLAADRDCTATAELVYE